MDAKAWRRGVMSDEEGDRLYLTNPNYCKQAIGAVLDEFVRRLGEIRVGHSCSHYPFTATKCADKEGRPAVLFVQGEKVEPEPDWKAIAARAAAILRGES